MEKWNDRETENLDTGYMERQKHLGTEGELKQKD